MGCKIIDNTKGFIITRPPLVVFILCVGAFAIAMVTLAYYVKIHQIQDPDITQDWNSFLDHFSQIRYCASRNETEDHWGTLDNLTSAPQSSSSPKFLHSDILEYEPVRNYSFMIRLVLKPMPSFVAFPHNITHFMGSVYGYQLGLEGSEADEQVNITFELPDSWHSQKCNRDRRGYCKQIEFTTCLTLMASPTVFPTTRRPASCNATESPREYHMSWLSTKTGILYEQQWCKYGAVAFAYHPDNPSLTPMLSAADRSLVNLHLMHTSYFLFVMVITAFCYAVIKGRPVKQRSNGALDKKALIQA
ncbi:transmembrane protein 248-like [Ptychodera flava]|uniref:transmembrane protein 248-like n=1 Tax=Ptychodera flava TaxID=63121 RepID=UPI003969F6CC